MVEDAKPWHKFCTGYSPIAKILGVNSPRIKPSPRNNS